MRSKPRIATLGADPERWVRGVPGLGESCLTLDGEYGGEYGYTRAFSPAALKWLTYWWDFATAADDLSD